MTKKAIVINKHDNVATSITDIEAGSTVTVSIEPEKKVKIRQSIPFGYAY